MITISVKILYLHTFLEHDLKFLSVFYVYLLKLSHSKVVVAKHCILKLNMTIKIIIFLLKIFKFWITISICIVFYSE